MNLHLVVIPTICSLLSPIEAGFGFGPGTDPFGFGNVSESCPLPMVPARNAIPNWQNFAPLHFLMMSKEHLTRLTQRVFDSLQVPPLALEEIDESCFVLQQFPRAVGLHHVVMGWGRFLQIPVYPLGLPGFARFDVLVPGDVGGMATVSLTDNESFNLGVICWDDGVGTWLVSSTKRKLSSKNVHSIRQHLLGLGFNGSNFINVDYSRCPPTPHIRERVSPHGTQILVEP